MDQRDPHIKSGWKQHRIPYTVVLRGKRPEQIRLSLVEFWAFVYAGCPAHIKQDERASISGGSFRKLPVAYGIRVQFLGLQLRNSIWRGETYREPLCRVFQDLRQQFLDMDPKIILRL